MPLCPFVPFESFVLLYLFTFVKGGSVTRTRHERQRVRSHRTIGDVTGDCDTLSDVALQIQALGGIDERHRWRVLLQESRFPATRRWNTFAGGVLQPERVT